METELTGILSVEHDNMNDMAILTYCNLVSTFVLMILRILGKTLARMILEDPSFLQKMLGKRKLIKH